MSRIRDILDQQAIDLDALQARQATQVLRALEDARRELREQLGAGGETPAGSHRLRVMLAQAEAGIAALRQRMGNALADAEPGQQDAARRHLIQTVTKAESKFRDAGSAWETASLRRLTEERGLALHRFSVDRYGAQVIEAVQRELAVGYALGLTPAALADRVAGVDGVIARHKGRAELIVRMELSRIYDAAHQASLEELARLDPPDTTDPLLKKADEFLEGARNHPFSFLLDGQSVLPRQEWEIDTSKRAGAGSGLVWRKTGTIAHGFGYPAHFNDRGRQVPHRMSWEGKRYEPKQSIRAAEVTRRDLAGLRRLDRGLDLGPTVSGAGLRTLEMAGYIDGSGRLLPAGRQRLVDDGRRQGRQTFPTLGPDPERKPRGKPKRVREGAENMRCDTRENETAAMLAKLGFDVEQLPERKPEKRDRKGKIVRAGGASLDYRVEGRLMDCYAPQPGTTAADIVQRTAKKWAIQGADRVILNLDDSDVDIEVLRRQFAADPALSATIEVICLRGGVFTHLLG
jgi:hypothetical protein